MNRVALRPYQERAIERLCARTRAGARRLLIVAPTGAGKTTIAGFVIADAIARGLRVLFVAHRRELISQAYARLLQLGVPEHAIGVLMGADARRRPGAMVQVASIDTLRHRAKPVAELVFVDEAHRALAVSYRELAAYYPDAIQIGLTATPYRADGRGLGEQYEELIVVASPRELIADGFLVAPRVFTVPRGELAGLDRVRTRGGDYDEGALAQLVDRPALVGNIVEHWQRHAAGIRTVVFAVSVAHSRHIAARFRDAGVSAEHLDGATDVAERDAILRRLDEGRTLVVTNCNVLCEGWDQPSVKCAVLARPTKSVSLYLQQAGRILRPWRSQDALILDHGGCALEHGLPQADREYSLDTKPRVRRGEQAAHATPVKVCDECHAVAALAAAVCEACGFVFERGSVPDEEAGELVELRDPMAPRPRRRPEASPEYFDQLLASEPSAAWARARFHVETRVRPPESRP